MIDTDAMRRRAEAWLAPSTTRDTAINEEQIALDVIDLLAEVERLRATLTAVLASAAPNERDHPCMSAAWKAATKVLEAK